MHNRRPMGKKVAVILSGCGVQDGAEVHEATLTLYFLDRAGATIVCTAPNREQAKVVNHATGGESGEKRNVLAESARIARGEIRDLKALNAGEVDAVILPGGFGAALNLCTFGAYGANCTVDPEVERFLREAHAKGRPIGAMCIAPALVARVFGADLHPELTIGDDKDTAAALTAMGARHVARGVDEIAIDAKNKIVTTPAYMLAGGPAQAGAGIEKLVKKVLEMA